MINKALYSPTCKSCGIILSDSIRVEKKKRYLCKYCYARSNREYYYRTRNKALKKKREKRQLQWKTYKCTMCFKEFVSYMPTVKVCSHECKVLRKKILRRISNRKKKELQDER